MSAEKDRTPALSQASMPVGAVFLSYASEDAAAAERIATALRVGGIDVWFDQSELRGGDVWDRSIRQQIHDCRLFIPVISAHTEARDEGYFRREWRLAIERAGDMAEDKAFVVPVAIDGTSERSARVPNSFKHVQWTRLPGGETPSTFVERVRRLLSPDAAPARGATLPGSTSAPISTTSIRQPWRSKAGLWVTGAVIAVALAAIGADRFLLTKHPPPATSLAPTATQPAARAAATVAAFDPPRHSIAVLPFVNMSGDKEQEYFSDGLTEELLNSLSRINELQVAARTSSFSFKGKDTDIGAIARKLNVAAILEGSVRRSEHRVRVSAQLINAVTGFHIWSQNYDRNLGDVLQLQSEVAEAVASALKVTLLEDVATKTEVGGTRNPGAFDAYLRGQQALLDAKSDTDLQNTIAAFSEAIRLDPSFAAAYAVRSRAFNDFARAVATTRPAIQKALDNAQADARRAIALAPDFDESHLALALYYEATLSFTLANEEYKRALSLSPNNVRTLWRYSSFAAAMGQTDAAVAAARRSVVLDPVQAISRSRLGEALYLAREYKDALAAWTDAVSLRPDDPGFAVLLGSVYYVLGDFQRARAFCESKPDSPQKQLCLAMTYERLGQHAEAQAALANVKALWGDSGAVLYAMVCAQWGKATEALTWLDIAVGLHDPGLVDLKMQPLLDPLRKEPRFQAVMRELKFPD
jgi:TolB-like protein/Tfp pilus assembly protein PilF